MTAKTNQYGLYIEAVLDLQDKLQKEVYELIKSGQVVGMSVGLEVIQSQYMRGVLIIKKANLIEISLTSNPVNDRCKIGFCESFNI